MADSRSCSSRSCLQVKREREREKDRECENEKRVRGRPLEESERGGKRLKLC